MTFLHDLIVSVGLKTDKIVCVNNHKIIGDIDTVLSVLVFVQQYEACPVIGQC